LIFKHEKRWRILSIYNQGLQGLNIETAVNNLSKYISSIQFSMLISEAYTDNSCVLNGFEGGNIQVRYRVVDSKLSIDYSTSDGTHFKSCIDSKVYAGLR
jgi:hypothetical protein